MATTTTPTASPSTALGFTPAFKRVAQEENFDDLFACIAMLAGQTLQDVKAVAVKQFRHPEHGPYFIDEQLIASLCAHYGLVSTVWKAVTSPIADLPDVAILMIEYSETTELGRSVVFHRMRPSSGPKPVIEYVVDPAPWVPPQMQIRVDLKALQASWFIGVHPMNAPATYSKK